MVALIAKYQYNRAAFVAYLSVEFNVAEINANEIFYNLMDWCQAHDGECDSIVIEEEAKSSSVNMHSIPFFDGACFGGKKYFFFEKKTKQNKTKKHIVPFQEESSEVSGSSSSGSGSGSSSGSKSGSKSKSGSGSSSGSVMNFEGS